jgi:hypothetical protein
VARLGHAQQVAKAAAASTHPGDAGTKAVLTPSLIDDFNRLDELLGVVSTRTADVGVGRSSLDWNDLESRLEFVRRYDRASTWFIRRTTGIASESDGP